MSEYRYILEPYNGMKTRYHCPNCYKKSVFTKYIDMQTMEYVNSVVGKCNRIVKCGYNYSPKQFFEDNNITFDTTIFQQVTSTVIQKPNTSFIDLGIMTSSKNNKSPNFFIDYLASLWDYETAYYLADRHNIGSSKYWKGSTVFWQMDAKGNIRSGKIIQYNAVTGKRVKTNKPPVQWVHKVLKLDRFNLEQCYFGEHLLKEDPVKPIAIVESEKTAIISSVFLPEFIWLACGSVHNLNESKTKELQGRNVVLFPDLKCFDLWNDKIPQLTGLASIRTSKLLENKASKEEKILGLDIADYLVKIK